MNKNIGVFILCVSILQAPNLLAVTKKDPVNTTDAKINAICGDLLKGSQQIISNPNKPLSVLDLFDPDPEKNLCARAPSMFMNATQYAAWLIASQSQRPIKDPIYGMRPMKIWPALHDGGKAAGGHRIIGQYLAINSIVDFILSAARKGSSNGKMLLLRGPGGVGKTEILNILANLATNLPLIDPKYTRYTFRWKDLDKIPGLKALLTDANPTIVNELQRSPLVLFSQVPTLLEKALDFGRQHVAKELGFEFAPHINPDPHTKQILKVLVLHYFPSKDYTVREYLQMLEAHVEIVPREIDPDAPPALIRYIDKDPNWTELTFDQNMFRYALLQDPNNPLAYHYRGLIPRADGFLLFLDELFRMPQQVIDFILDLIQNGAVQRGGAPTLDLDALVMVTSNDENIKQVVGDGHAVQALMGRAQQRPFRGTLNPTEAIATLIAMVLDNPKIAAIRKQTLFEMKSLTSNSHWEPFDFNTVFPAPNEDGKYPEFDGRYVLRYGLGNDEYIHIAPRALQMIALTSVATRLVTDPKAGKDIVSENDLVKKADPLFTNPAFRLEVLLGIRGLQNKERAMLEHIMFELKEGDTGILPREAHTWFEEALKLAHENHNTLTPAVVAKAFRNIVSQGIVEIPPNQRPVWIALAKMVKSHFIAEFLGQDVTNIISGNQSRVADLYDEIVQEILALSKNPDARIWQSADGTDNPILFDRLSKIKAIYKVKYQRELDLGDIKTFNITRTAVTDRHPELLSTIRKFLVDNEIETKSLTAIRTAFEGKGQNPELNTRIAAIRAVLADHGYNETACLEALRFIEEMRLQ
ncbi:MAG: sigma 54-interacting transcriptional regulator, partial [Bdellovibrio sp.]|nr:sigma 54-interacting transcriptional regulator [Bdellovibrio sp.]